LLVSCFSIVSLCLHRFVDHCLSFCHFLLANSLSFIWQLLISSLVSSNFSSEIMTIDGHIRLQHNGESSIRTIHRWILLTWSRYRNKFASFYDFYYWILELFRHSVVFFVFHFLVFLFSLSLSKFLIIRNYYVLWCGGHIELNIGRTWNVEAILKTIPWKVLVLLIAM
jgi:hypothetical protein